LSTCQESALIVGHQVTQKLVIRLLQGKVSSHESLSDFEMGVEECSLTTLNFEANMWRDVIVADQSHFTIAVVFSSKFPSLFDYVTTLFQNYNFSPTIIFFGESDSFESFRNLFHEKFGTDFKLYRKSFSSKLYSKFLFDILDKLNLDNLYNRPYTIHLLLPSYIQKRFTNVRDKILLENKKSNISFAHTLKTTYYPFDDIKDNISERILEEEEKFILDNF
jgi:hypothetical protein